MVILYTPYIQYVTLVYWLLQFYGNFKHQDNIYQLDPRKIHTIYITNDTQFIKSVDLSLFNNSEDNPTIK